MKYATNSVSACHDSLGRKAGLAWLVMLIIGSTFGSATADDLAKQLAYAAVTEGQYLRAIGHFERFPVRTDADESSLARAYFMIGDFDHASVLAEKLLDRVPGNIEAMLVIGDAMARQGKWQVALNFYLQSAQTADAPKENWLRVGQAWQALSRPEFAELAFATYRRLAGSR